MKYLSWKEELNILKESLQHIYNEHEANTLSNRLLEDILDISPTKRLIIEQDVPTKEQKEDFESASKRLLKNEPLQYITGFADFYDLKFKVNLNVLIPRQETEELVHLIIEENKSISNLSFLDFCTGSSCIISSIAKNLQGKNNKYSATDISKDTLKVAIENAKNLELDIDFRKHNLLEDSLIEFYNFADILICNPPYVMNNEKEVMHKNVLDYEPDIALFVEDNNPLVFYKIIADNANKILKPNGKCYIEINEQLGKETSELFNSNIFDTKVLKDLNNKDRFVIAYKK